jgi:uncharacterized protein
MIEPGFAVPDIVKYIIDKYYPINSLALKYYFTHCVKVTELALKINDHNRHLLMDEDFIIKGAMLHDIGIIQTNSPEIGCNGNYPYIAHTYLGRAMLEREGLPLIAPVCERHIGVGLSEKDIISADLPLPHRDMLPLTNEEKVICYADKFYSKSEEHLVVPKSLSKIRKKIIKYGEEKLNDFDELVNLFGSFFIY